jgi:hypothetical protein
MNTRHGLYMIVSGLACSALWTAQSLAGNPAPKVADGPTVDFVKADRNSDGMISKDEALLVPDLTSAFEMLDSDEDEVISRTEFSHWSRAGKVDAPATDPATLPGGSAGSQHMPGD